MYNLILTIFWFNVCSTSEIHLLNTGSAYGINPDCNAVATLDKH